MYVPGAQFVPIKVPAAGQPAQGFGGGVGGGGGGGGATGVMALDDALV